MKLISTLFFILIANTLFSQKALKIINNDRRAPKKIAETFHIADGIYYLVDTDKVRSDNMKYPCVVSYNRFRSGIVKNILDSSIVINQDTIPMSKISYIGDLREQYHRRNRAKTLTAITFGATAIGGIIIYSYSANGVVTNVIPAMIGVVSSFGFLAGSIGLIINKNNGYNMKRKNLSFQVSSVNK